MRGRHQGEGHVKTGQRWGDVAASRGKAAATRSQERDLEQIHPQGFQPCPPFMSDFALQHCQGMHFCPLEAPVCGPA